MKHAAEFKVISLRECPNPALTADTPEVCVKFWLESVASSDWYSADREQFCVIFLNTRFRVTGFTLVGVGSLDTVTVHPREVFRAAIIHNAAAIVIGHNHPSGDPSPSEADVRVTRDLIGAGQLLKLQVKDHIIIGDSAVVPGKGYASLRELGHFY